MYDGDLAAFEHYAPVGIDIECGILRLVDGQLGNIANIIAIGISMFITLSLIFKVTRRVAAVGALRQASSLFSNVAPDLGLARR